MSSNLTPSANGWRSIGSGANRWWLSAFGVGGYCFRYDRPVVYWRRLSNGGIGIVTILHERMHRIDRFRGDFGL